MKVLALAAALLPIVLARFCDGAGTATDAGGGDAAAVTDGGARPQVCGDGFVDFPEVCDDGNLIGDDLCSAGCDQEWLVQQWGPFTGEIDVLFVVDNSGSMCEEQMALRAGFASFISGLTSRGEVDFHIGVITTDTMDPMQSGRLQSSPNPILSDDDCMLAPPPPLDCVTGLPSPLPKILDPSTPDIDRVFGCISQVGIDGFGGEAALAAVELALSEPLVSDPAANGGFLRDDSLLAVLFVGDEDDCSVCLDPSFPGQCSFLPSITQNLDCLLWMSELLTPVSTFVEAMEARRPPGKLFVASIIGLDEAGSSAGPLLPDTDPAHLDEALPICESAYGRAAPAPRLEEFTRAFEPLFAVESICEPDFAPPLLSLGEQLALAEYEYCLWRRPCPGIGPEDVRIDLQTGATTVSLGPGDFTLEPDSACPGGTRIVFAVPPAYGTSVTVVYPAVSPSGEGCGA